MKKETKRKIIEWLISLAITLVMLGLVVGIQYWYTCRTQISFMPMGVWIGNAVGGMIMLLIVHHFIKRPDDAEK